MALKRAVLGGLIVAGADLEKIENSGTGALDSSSGPREDQRKSKTLYRRGIVCQSISDGRAKKGASSTGNEGDC